MFHHLLADGLGTQESPFQVHRQDPVPLVYRHFQNGASLADSGVVHQDIDRSIGFDHALDHRLYLSGVGNIYGKEASFEPSRFQSARSLRSHIFQLVGNSHSGAVFRKLGGNRLSDT